ncbi:MAG: hypothetical protein PHX18_04840 [Candidatus Gastranaerophilales bacterium]|nr:hypothetical protein [Candidatus Gastranaerophilales bacterium]
MSFNSGNNIQFNPERYKPIEKTQLEKTIDKFLFPVFDFFSRTTEEDAPEAEIAMDKEFAQEYETYKNINGNIRAILTANDKKSGHSFNMVI